MKIWWAKHLSTTTGSGWIPCWWSRGFCGAPSRCCWKPTSLCGWSPPLSWRENTHRCFLRLRFWRKKIPTNQQLISQLVSLPWFQSWQDFLHGQTCGRITHFHYIYISQCRPGSSHWNMNHSVETLLSAGKWKLFRSSTWSIIVRFSGVLKKMTWSSQEYIHRDFNSNLYIYVSHSFERMWWTKEPVDLLVRSLNSLKEERLLFDVVLFVPLPPRSLYVFNALLLWRGHLQVSFFKMPLWPNTT